MSLEHIIEGQEPIKEKRTYRQRERKSQNMTRIIVTPKNTTELKAYYEIYSLDCQRTDHIVPKFRDFIIEMSKIGFLSWREKNKK